MITSHLHDHSISVSSIKESASEVQVLLRASWKLSYMKTSSLRRLSNIIMLMSFCGCLKSKASAATSSGSKGPAAAAASRAMSSSTSTNGSSNVKLPSSMTGPPVSSLVAPGKCQFGEELVAVPLLERFPVSSTSSVLRFGLPDTTLALNLSTCACILANAEINGEAVTRPYTPISTNNLHGCFDLLVKDYGLEAKMSRHLCDTIQPGDTIHFKHISFNVKIQAPFPYQHICMIVGGTGITPMIQALHAILGQEKKQKVTMLYGSKVSDDILGQELLDKWQADYADQFTLVHVLSNEPTDSDWKGARGFIDKSMIEKYFPSPTSSETGGGDDDSFCIFVCGPPPMYNALSGPREESDSVKGLLGDMGYKPNQVYKF